MGEPSPLLAALERHADLGPTPELARIFDRISAHGAEGAGEGPDFFETSPQVGDALAPWRMTHYFDLKDRAAGRRAEVFSRLRALADELGVPDLERLEPALGEAAPPEPAMRQLCLGVDVRRETGHSRVKLYAIFEGDAEAWTRALCLALGHPPPEAARLSLTHIVGLDFTLAGLHDLKLYFAMEPRKVTRTLRRPQLAIPLLRGCRRVVYQHSLIVPGKKSMHFHADAPSVMHGELARLRAHAPATAELERRLGGLREGGLEPWILAHPFAEGELERGVYSLYLHLS